MTDAVILSACRTAIGTALPRQPDRDVGVRPGRGGGGGGPSPILARRRDIDDVVLGEGLYGGGVIARYAAITQGMVRVPGMAVNRHCAAGLAAVQVAAANIRAGMADALIAGGTNSASTSPTSLYRTLGTEDAVERWMPRTHPETPDAPTLDMSITVGWNTAVRGGHQSRSHGCVGAPVAPAGHRRHREGRFTDEIVPMKITPRTVRWCRGRSTSTPAGPARPRRWLR